MNKILPAKPKRSFYRKGFEQEIEKSWQQYKDGKFITHEDLKKKYGL